MAKKRTSQIRLNGNLNLNAGRFNNSAFNELNRLQQEEFGIQQQKWKLDRDRQLQKTQKERAKAREALDEQQAQARRTWEKTRREHEEKLAESRVDNQKQMLDLRDKHIKAVRPVLEEAVKKEATLRYAPFTAFTSPPPAPPMPPPPAPPMPPVGSVFAPPSFPAGAWASVGSRGVRKGKGKKKAHSGRFTSHRAGSHRGVPGTPGYRKIGSF